MATNRIVRPEYKNVVIPTIPIPDNMMHTSIPKIMIPGFIDSLFAIIFASKSVPPVVVSYRSINPIPKPINVPPKIALMYTGMSQLI